MKIIITTEEELTEIVYKAVQVALYSDKKGIGEKLYYINQVAKMLGKSHSTIKKSSFIRGNTHNQRWSYSRKCC